MFTFSGRRFAGILMAGALSFGLVAMQDVEAKRLGGSRSVGKQSNNVTQMQQRSAQQPANGAAPAQQAAPAGASAAGNAANQAPRRNWGGILGGLAAGLGLGYLLSHFGLAEGFANFLGTLLMVGLIAMVGVWLLRKFRGRPAGTARNEAAYAAAGGPSFRTDMAAGAPQAPLNVPPTGTMLGASPGQGASFSVPPGFDSDNFLRHAKVYFVRLQASWDAGNLNDIREFTTPEMFAEIRMDLNDRGATPNRTDVVTLDAELLGIEQNASEYVASVRFSGTLREQEGAAAEPFAEVWNLTKPIAGGGGWVLAGIQQLH